MNKRTGRFGKPVILLHCFSFQSQNALATFLSLLNVASVTHPDPLLPHVPLRYFLIWAIKVCAGACNYPIFLSRRFHRPIYFCLNLSRTHIATGTSVTNCTHKHALMSTCRYVHVRLHCFILTEACSCRLELGYFAGKISKKTLVCKNAVGLTYYGSCRLLVCAIPKDVFF